MVGAAGSSSTPAPARTPDRKSTRLNSSHSQISYAVFCLKKKKKQTDEPGPLDLSDNSAYRLQQRNNGQTPCRAQSSVSRSPAGLTTIIQPARHSAQYVSR